MMEVVCGFNVGRGDNCSCWMCRCFEKGCVMLHTMLFYEE